MCVNDNCCVPEIAVTVGVSLKEVELDLSCVRDNDGLNVAEDVKDFECPALKLRSESEIVRVPVPSPDCDREVETDLVPRGTVELSVADSVKDRLE